MTFRPTPGQPTKLPDLAERLLSRQDLIIEDWARRVRAHVAGAEHLEHPVLVDGAPLLLRQLAKTLSLSSADDPETEVNQAAHEHAGERAELHVYDPDHVVHEYQLMRDVVCERMATDLAVDVRARALVRRFFDSAVREAVAAFVETQGELRDHLNTAMAQGLRNTLGVVRMAAEIAMDEAEDARATRSLLARIRSSALRADRIIQDVLDLFTLRAGRRLRLDLNQRDLLALAKAVASEHTEQTGDRFEVTGDSVVGWWAHATLKRALDNLIENAIRMGDAGATTTIVVRDEGERVSVSLHNTGRVVDPNGSFDEVQHQARARRVERGRRLSASLTLARGVAESHGGGLILTGVPGEGPTYTMNLPRDARPFQT